MKNDNYKMSKSGSVSFMCSILALFNGIFSAYVLNYNPKIGEYHIWLCSILGVLLAIFTVFIIIWCIKLLKRNEPSKRIIICIVMLAIFTGAMWTHTVWPYYKDIIGGSKIVITDSYLVASDKLYFLDDGGNEVDLPISEDISNELWARENYEYIVETNLIKYYDKIAITYFPESRVIISISLCEAAY